MGAKITVYNRRSIGGEPGGDLEISSASLVGTTVGAKEVPLAIDELPLFALAASCARGTSVLRGAAELRAKESDRIDATVDALRALGVRAQGTDDGLTVTGVPARPRGGRIASRGIPSIDLLPVVTREPDPAALYIAGDGHFSVLGHRVAGRAVSLWITEQRLLP